MAVVETSRELDPVSRPSAALAPPLVSVVTAVRNGAPDIRHTIDSVLAQTYPNIEYIVVDGASSDGTREIVESYGPSLAGAVSEPDGGLYDGLSKGFQRARGEILCYINAGDFYLPHALSVVAEIFRDASVDWLVGGTMDCNPRNEITAVGQPFRFKRRLIRTGSYGTGLPFIPQESTFWRASLMSTVDLGRWTTLRLAGDCFLWWSFARAADLRVVDSPLGVFKRQVGQLSEDRDAYRAEMATFTEARGLGIRLEELYERALWAIHPRHRALISPSVLRYDSQSQSWRMESWRNRNGITRSPVRSRDG